jgi:hypothetical protein
MSFMEGWSDGRGWPRDTQPPAVSTPLPGLAVKFHHSCKSFVSIECESDGTEQLIGGLGSVSSRVARSLVTDGMSQHSLPSGPTSLNRVATWPKHS